MKWFCSSSLCYNNLSSKNVTGNKSQTTKESQNSNEYQKILITTGINWEKGRICAKHGTKRYRQNFEYLPDIIAPSSQILNGKEK